MSSESEFPWSLAILVMSIAFLIFTITNWSSEEAAKLVKRTQSVLNYRQPDEYGNPGDTTLTHVERLKARAVPNKRLVTVFNIDNIFTTIDPQRAIDFRKDAVLKVKDAVRSVTPHSQGHDDSDEDWTSLKAAIQAITDGELRRLGAQFRLDTFIRNITLAISLHFMFGLSADRLDQEAVRVQRIGTAINALWITSKDLGPAGVRLTDYLVQQELFDDLKALVPTFIMGLNSTNPLNFILPVYETMWRAVKLGFLELYWRFPKDSSTTKHDWLDVLFKYHPSLHTFSSTHCDNQLQAKDVVKEILRLYPPARRVYRRFEGQEEDSVADIGAVHRNELLAGPDPLVFRPARWIDIRRKATKNGMDLKSYEESLGFFPFARACPAGKEETKGFGFKMVAVILSELLKHAWLGARDDRHQGWEIEDEPPSCDVPLEAGRIMGDGLMVIRRS